MCQTGGSTGEQVHHGMLQESYVLHIKNIWIQFLMLQSTEKGFCTSAKKWVIHFLNTELTLRKISRIY